MSDVIVIQQTFGACELARIRVLRYEILRKPHKMPPSSAAFPGDENESTLHLIALFQAELIGCSTLLIDDSDAIQLRGMAVARHWQRRGIGHRMVETAQDIATTQKKTLRCNARCSASGFYERHGWVQSGSMFDVPGIGHHIVMNWTGKFEKGIGLVNKMLKSGGSS